MAFGRSSLAFVLIHCVLIAGCDSNGANASRPPVVFKAPSERVAKLLRERHAKFANVRSVDAEFTMTGEDVAWRETTKGAGRLRYLHPKKSRADFTGDRPESLVFPGDGKMWLNDPTTKRVTVFPLGKNADPLCDHRMAPLWFQWLLPVSSAKFDADHELVVIEESDTEIHLKGRHRVAGNRGSVITIEKLVIDAKTLAPKKLVALEESGNRVTIEYTSIRLNPKIDPKVFAGKVPEGWKATVNPWNLFDQ